MTREEQDKNWALLSEESKSEYRTEYKYRLEDSERDPECPEGGGDLTVFRSQTIVEELENMFGLHNLKPTLTYESVHNKLYEHKCNLIQLMCTTSIRHERKIEAINKLLEVAKYLNKDWKPDFYYSEIDENGYILKTNWFFYIDHEVDDNGTHNETLAITNESCWCTAPVYFHTKELAEQALEILGEETIRLALGDY